MRLVATAVLAALAGCAAVALPDGPSAEDARVVAAHLTAGPCVVTRAGGRDGRPVFASALAATGLFERVDAVVGGELPPGAAWIVCERSAPWVDPFDNFCGDGAQVLTTLTLGIVPLVRERSSVWCIGVRRAGEPEHADRLFYVGEPVTSIGGWIAAPLLLMPWWWTTPDSGLRADREAELIVVAIVKSGILDEPPPAR